MKYERLILEKLSNQHAFFAVVLRRKTVFGWAMLCVGAITAVTLLMIPPTYRAETKILPPQMRYFDAYPQVYGAGGHSPELLRTAAAVGVPNYLYIGMLRSRTILDRVIDKFDLMTAYDCSYREDARERLAKSLDTTSSKYGIISISVDHGDPQTAADMANAFIEELTDLIKEMAVTEASQRRLLFERELHLVKEKLNVAEESMREFQESTGAIEIEEQAESIIESFSQLRAKISAKTVDLKVLASYTTPRHPDYQRAEEELNGMREQLFLLEQSAGGSFDPFVPTGSIPSVETNYLRKLRELKYYETLFELMGRQYEIARVDEARESIIIQVLDKALPPERQIKPNRLLMLSVALCGGLILSLTSVFLVEYLGGVRRAN